MVKNPSAKVVDAGDSWVQSLEKEKATYSNILAWEIPWSEEPGGLQFMGSQSTANCRKFFKG